MLRQNGTYPCLFFDLPKSARMAPLTREGMDKRRTTTFARKCGAVMSSRHRTFARHHSRQKINRTWVTSFTNSDAPKAIRPSFPTCSSEGGQPKLCLGQLFVSRSWISDKALQFSFDLLWKFYIRNTHSKKLNMLSMFANPL